MKRGVFPIILSVICLVLACIVGASIVLVVQGTDGIVGSIALQLFSFFQRYLGFAVSGSPGGLIPLAALFLALGILSLICRRHPAYWWSLPLLVVIYYTIFLMAMMRQGSVHPAWILDPLYARGTGRFGGVMVLILCIFLETLVGILCVLIASPLDARHQKRRAMDLIAQKRRAEHEATQAPVEKKPKQKKQPKSPKQKKQQDVVSEEVHDETLVTFAVDGNGNEVEPGIVHPVKPLDPDAPLSFPKLGDRPKLKSRVPKAPASEDVNPMELGSSINAGAFDAVKKESDYLASQQEVVEEDAKGFRKAAKEAMNDTNANSQPVASAKFFTSGQLVAAVAQAQGTQGKPSQAKAKNTHLQSSLAQAQEQARMDAWKTSSVDAEVIETEPEPIKAKHRLFGLPSLKKKVEPQPTAIQPELEEVEEVVEVEVEEVEPVAVPSMSEELVQLKQKLAEERQQQGVSSFAPTSTARPINGGYSEDAPVPAPTPQPISPEDDMDMLSGVGGLASSNSGKSALINRKKLFYQFPSPELLVSYPDHGNDIDEATIQSGELLIETLQQFKIQATLLNIVKGPTVTMYEVSPAPGVRVNTIVNLADNIALSLAAQRVRIVAPIPGKQAVGIEVPNKKRQIIGFREMLAAMDASEFAIPMVLGRTITGEPVVTDLASTPHLLIAGSTGSGKSVCVNSLICSILYRKSPKDVRLIMVDPKIVELKIYNGIPHLLTPVITEAKKTIKALDFCIYEMDRRYRLLQSLNVRNIMMYNKKIVESRVAREKLPYIAVIIDEFADLMATVPKELENKVARLAAMSRAVGIHLVLATQRPSVNVITGLIKSNIPSRIAFAVASAVDSRIIIDEIGAEKLLGKGDMLFSSNVDPSATRIQGAFLSDDEVERIVEFARGQGEPDYIDEAFFEDDEREESSSDDEGYGDDDSDLMDQALKIVVERKGASASYLQRRLRIGYNRAARLVEQMEDMGYVGPPNGSKPRELLRYPD